MAVDDALDGLDPVDLMEAEATRIEAFFAQLPDDGWHRPSRCEGWTARDLLAHLAATEEYHHACLDGRVSALLEEMAERGVTTVAEFNAVGIAGLDGVPNDEVLSAWSRDDADTRRRFRERGEGEVDSSVGLYSARWQAFHLAGELATHADDIFVPIPATDRDVRRDWRARFSYFALREAKPHLGVERVAGRARITGEGLTVELDDQDFIEAVAGRADPSRVDDDARAMLSLVP